MILTSILATCTAAFLRSFFCSSKTSVHFSEFWPCLPKRMSNFSSGHWREHKTIWVIHLHVAHGGFKPQCQTCCLYNLLIKMLLVVYMAYLKKKKKAKTLTSVQSCKWQSWRRSGRSSCCLGGSSLALKRSVWDNLQTKCLNFTHLNCDRCKRAPRSRTYNNWRKKELEVQVTRHLKILHELSFGRLHLRGCSCLQVLRWCFLGDEQSVYVRRAAVWQYFLLWKEVSWLISQRKPKTSVMPATLEDYFSNFALLYVCKVLKTMSAFKHFLN